jgi:WD40 repeat protein
MIISTDSEGNLHFWDGEIGSHIIDINTDNNAVNNLAFNHDGSLMATSGSDGIVLLWGIQNQK